MRIINIKTNTLISKIAFKAMKADKDTAVAVVIGKTINLQNITPEEFVKRDMFLRHEMQHVIQFNNDNNNISTN